MKKYYNYNSLCLGGNWKFLVISQDFKGNELRPLEHKWNRLEQG